MEQIIQITSGKGPVECERLVALLWQEFSAECSRKGIPVEIREMVPGEMPLTFQSIVAKISCDSYSDFRKSWEGSIQWICPSPFRKNHKRKNWFAAVSFHEENSRSVLLNENEVEFSAMKSSGPGGQHVNKTMSAVRALHRPTGVIVTAYESRSQHENRKLALKKMEDELQRRAQNALQFSRKRNWNEHSDLERGNAVRVYEGLSFFRRKRK